jgi:hypothetical protein
MQKLNQIASYRLLFHRLARRRVVLNARDFLL